MFVIRHDLHTELPLREISALDSVIQVLRGVVEVRALQLIRFRLGEIVNALFRNPVILH